MLSENLHERPPIQNISIAIHSISKAGYVTGVLAIVRTELRARPGGEQFLWFLKNDLAISPHFILFY